MATLAEMKAELAAIKAELQQQQPQQPQTLAEMKAELAELRAPEPSKSESAVRGALQGSTLGFGDEIMGRIAQGYIGARKALGIDPEDLFEGDVYEQARDEIRTENQAAREANPWTYGGAEVVGSVLPAVLTGGGGTTAQIGKAGLYGGTYGAGSSEADTAEGVAKDAITTGLLTAGTAGILKGIPPTVKAGKGLLDKAASKIPFVNASGGDVLATGAGLMSGGLLNGAGSLATKKFIVNPLVARAAGAKTAEKAMQAVGKNFTPGQNSKYLTGLLQAIHDDSTSP